jgi:hypothetical protein
MSFLRFALAALLFVPAAMADDAPLRVTLAEGGVTVTLASGGPPGPVVEGDSLHEGDTVHTAPGARVEITMQTGSVLRLGESSRMTLGQVAPGKAFSAKLFLGNLWTKVHKLIATESYQVETENAVAGVRGTEFRVEVAPGQQDMVRVYEGTVEVKAHDGSWTHRVEPNRELRFARAQKPSSPKAFDVASEHEHKFMKWVRSRPAREGQERLKHLDRKERKKK